MGAAQMGAGKTGATVPEGTAREGTAAALGPRLVALNTVLAGNAFPIEGAASVVGRVEGCGVVIQHKSVSRSHCRLEVEGGHVRVVDLKSANGTLVNGVELEQAVLKSGDVLELGRVLLRFVPAGEAFSLSAEEIARARAAEASADDWQDDSTLTSLAASGLQISSRRPLLWAAAVAALLVAGGLALWLGRAPAPGPSSSDPAATAEPPR